MSTVLPTLANKVLGFTDFIKILTTELTTQDPFSPFRTEDFINQVTSMQTFQTVSELSESIKGMRNSSKMGFATSLIGKMVAVTNDNGDMITGIVQGINLEDDEVKIVINNESYSLERVIAVTIAPSIGSTAVQGGVSGQSNENNNI